MLADVLSVRRQFARSANLERDAENAEPLDGYVVTARALDVVERIASSALGPAGGAWSVTGPYGSGKSSLGLLLDAAFGPPGIARDRALDKIAEASPTAKNELNQALSSVPNGKFSAELRLTSLFRVSRRCDVCTRRGPHRRQEISKRISHSGH